jgi:hypothetical protein
LTPAAHDYNNVTAGQALSVSSDLFHLVLSCSALSSSKQQSTTFVLGFAQDSLVKNDSPVALGRQQSMPVNVVFGAGGPTGLECVKRLLAVTTEPVRAVVRDPATHGDKLRQAAGKRSIGM